MFKLQFNGYTSKAAAIRAVNKVIEPMGHKLNSVLGAPESNTKVKKTLTELNIYTYTHNLAPANVSGVMNTCPWASNGCAAACLHTAGNPAYQVNKNNARIARTYGFKFAREAYIAALAWDIHNVQKKHQKDGDAVAFRLNTTSDIPWEKVTISDGDTIYLLMAYFRDIQFYDYTKSGPRAIQASHDKSWPQNYHLTFSLAEDNDVTAKGVLHAGGSVAAVINLKPSEEQPLNFKLLGDIYPTFSMDDNDYRPLDMKGGIGLLTAKGDAKKDTSGFVRDAVEVAA